MASYYRFVTVLLLLITGNHPVFSSVPIYMSDSIEAYDVKGISIDYLEDKTGTLTISDVSSPAYEGQFVNSRHVSTNKNISSTYWISVSIFNETTRKKHWLFELFDFRTDYFEIYVPDALGHFSIFKGGAKFPFDARIYKHKNFVYDINLPKGPSTIYVKIKAERPVAFIGGIRTHLFFISYATTEYLSLALFYGIVLAMSLYNIFLYFALRDRTYLFYVLYVACIGIYASSQDGLGFEYLWPNYPSWNDYVFPVSIYSMVIWALFYARSFLNTKKLFPVVDKIILGIIFLRTVVFIAELFYPTISFAFWIDVIPLAVAYIAGIVSLFSGQRVARFYVLAFSMLFSGFLINALQHLHLIDDSIFTVYSFNFGVLCEMILLSLALADRIKTLNMEKEIAQRATIAQLQENERLKDNINLELESKVRERTSELEFKNKELDTFVYRASHDIKGPLKSIIGLTSVGLKDLTDPKALNYFEHILKSSKRLDHLVADLLAVTQVKESRLKVTRINFDKTIKEILYSLDHLPDYSRVNVEFSIKEEEEFFSDEKIIYSIFQNLIENAIKYRDAEKEKSYLDIKLEIKNSFATIEFKDNGIGIAPEFAQKIFDMFYKVNDASSGSGLGLYMVRSSVERLGGVIKLQSTQGQGSTFTVTLKNHPTEIPSAIQ